MKKDPNPLDELMNKKKPLLRLRYKKANRYTELRIDHTGRYLSSISCNICMQTRSKGNQHLLRYIDNINRLPRELREQQEAPPADNLVGMENQQVQQDPPQGNLPRRNIGAGDAPSTHTQRQGIVPPAIPNNNFEIKNSLITMIQGNKFHGLPMEDPLDHLDEFDRLCGLTKINGVSEDAFKLRLFPFSLGDKAHKWEKALPQGSITSWDECKKAFLAKFFSNSRTAKLRNEISGFVQKNGESFAEAWERFKNSAQKCPHHGFSQESLLSTLYRGVLPKFRMMLDTASNGTFLNKDVEDGWELVENLAQSDGNYNEDFDRTVRSSTDSDEKTRKEMKALNEKLDKLLLVQQKQMTVVSEAEQAQIQDGEAEFTEEMCYMQNQGGFNRGFNNFRPNPNLSYRNTNVANPQDQVYPPQQLQQQQQRPFNAYSQNQGYAPQQHQGHTQQQPQHNIGAPPGFQPYAPPTDVSGILQQLLQGQTASAIDSAKKFAELNTKVEALNSKVKYMESNQTSTSAVKSSGQLPGKAVQNPKEFCNAICSTYLPIDDTTSDVEFCTFHFDIDVDDLVVEHAVISAMVEKKAPHTVSEDSDIPDGEDFSASQVKDGKTSDEQSIDDQDRPTDRSVAPCTGKFVDSEEKAPIYVPPPYKPPLPFPGRFKKGLIAKNKALFDEKMKEIEARMPLSEAIKLIPESHKFLKELVLERIKETQEEQMPREECSIIAKEDGTPEKLGDPGSFTLPCSLGSKVFDKGLCDLGSSVSLMPLSVAKKLGFSKYKHSNISLILADRSVKKPHGLLEDLPVKVGEVNIPTDFVVLEMDEEPMDPILLGRPFLATAGAVIDVKAGKIDLNVGNGMKMTFDINKAARKPTINGQSFYIEEKEQSDEAPPEFNSARDSSTYTCNAILTREGDEVWEEEESDEDEHSEDDFSDCHGILTSNLARSRARKREQLAAATDLACTSGSSVETYLPAKDLEPAPDDCSELQALKRKSEWQDQTIRQLTISVRELACMVKENKEQIEQLQGQISGSPSKDDSGFSVNGQKLKVVFDEVTPERSSKPLLHPPEA